MPISPALRATIAKINKKMGEGSLIVGSDIHKIERPTITSGSLSLDAALGGGWAVNHWIEVVGHESVGKTMLILKTIAANQRRDPKWMTLWVAAEDFDDHYAQMLGVDLDRILLMDENTMEAVYEATIEFLETREIDCIVIDSLPALVPAREEDNSMEDFQPGLAAFLTGKFFRKSNPSMKRSLTVEERPITGFVVNQWTEKIGGYGDPRVTWGGKRKNFFYYQRVDVRRREFIKNSRQHPVGQRIEVVNLKNKYARPGLIGEIDAYVADYQGHRAGSYDTIKDIRSAAIAYGVLEKVGQKKYRFGDQEWVNGQPQVDRAIAEDKRLRAEIRKAVIAAATKPAYVEAKPEPAPARRKRTAAAPRARRTAR